MKDKLGIIGHFGGDKRFYDGQTVKTLTMRKGLEKYCEDDFELICADTYYIKHGLLRFVFQFIHCLVSCKMIIVLLSKKGRRIIFPVLYLSAKLFGKRIYHCAIGGRLADEAENVRVRKYISSFKANWVETKELEQRLLSMGVNNAEYLPNFKSIEPVDADKLISVDCPPYRFCTFSRVVKEKGIEDAIEAVSEINKEMDNIALLDIYGQIEPAYEESFKMLMEKTDSSINYCGTVEPTESVSVLSGYYMLLFPTYWRGEGVPGTIIDALSSGLPVIARKWQYCDEMLEHGVTGYCYPYDSPEELARWIKTAIAEEKTVLEMRRNCVEYAKKYDISICMEKIKNSLKS